ncbi:MAG: thiamine pyrophosphate-binding protein [Kiritimatiellae bacterium]|nr:thiamine pyrophosphate-binding protein [Kiritimatiellia bacterium]MDD5519739.1 thiamine pyrophosphate-binding protein [Kiritimatiellia bacterium]
MNVCESMVVALESIGVDAFFSGSGQGPGGIMFALKNSKKLRTIITKHEQGAAFMACGYSMYTNKLGVCNAQGGPGAFNLLSGVAVALSDSIPLLSISSYASTKWAGMGELGEVTGLYRTPDQQKMFAATTKKTFIINHPKTASDIFEEAINIAYNDRPGPVHIDIRTDVMGMEATHHRDITLEIKPILPKKKDVELFADVLTTAIKAKKKVIAHIGFGTVRSHAEAEILRFIDRFQIPFVTTMDAKGVIPENHPLCLGMGGISADPGAHKAYKEAEVVLAIGNSFAKWQCWRFQEDIFDNKTLLHINIERHEFNRVFDADYTMVSDVKPAITALTEAMSKRIGPVEKPVITIDKHILRKVEYKGNKVHPGQLAMEMSRMLPDKSILLGDAGAHMIWLAAYTSLNKGQNYKNPGSFGPMASHTNAAVGAQLANPDRRVIVGTGDGCYLMAGLELMTAVEHKLPIIWVIFNNSEFNIIKLFHLTIYKKEAFNKYPTPDFAKIAQACGANGFRIEKLNDFAPAFQAALKSDKPTVIDVITDPESVMPFKFYND